MTNACSLVLLPGMDGTGRLFRPLLRALGEEIRAQVVAYPPDQNSTYDDLADLVSRSLPSDEPFVMLAESFSGPVAIKVAASRPPYLAGLILCASFLVSPVPKWLRFFVSAAVFRHGVSTALLHVFVLNGGTRRAVVEEATAVVRSVAPAVLAARLRALLQVNVTEALRSCPAPILYIAPSKDRLVGARGLATIRRARPDVESVVLQGPHFLLQARPRESVDDAPVLDPGTPDLPGIENFLRCRRRQVELSAPGGPRFLLEVVDEPLDALADMPGEPSAVAVDGRSKPDPVTGF